MYSGSTSGTIFIPDSCWPIVYRYDEPQYAAVRAVSTNDMTTAGNNVAEYLNSHVISGDTYKYQSKDLLQQASQLQSLSESSNRQLIWIAAISLVVGGVGIMNIMLVSVTERTKEIGLRMAVGARPQDIMRQFLLEAVLLCVVGGALGILLGKAISTLVSRTMNWATASSPEAMVLAVGVSVLIGLVFGWYPSWKASKMDPIDALRHE